MATERATLGFGQRLVLLGAWLVSCGFVYVLGVYVGKGMHDRGPASPGVSLPVDATVPPAPPADAQAPLTFYDVLGTRDGGAPAAPAAPPRPAQRDTLAEQKLPAAVPPSPAPAAPAVIASVPPPAQPAPIPPAAAPSVPAGASTPPPLAAARPTAPASKPAPPPVAAPAAPPPAPAPPTPAATPPSGGASLPAQTPSGRWTVYASPSRDRLAVDHERAALRAKGYPAEVVTLRRDGDTWYRIRVGRYATEAQAEEASRRLRTDGVGHAFVQSE